MEKKFDKINQQDASDEFKTRTNTIIVKDLPYKVYTAGDKDLTIIGIEEMTNNYVTNPTQGSQGRRMDKEFTYCDVNGASNTITGNSTNIFPSQKVPKKWRGFIYPVKENGDEEASTQHEGAANSCTRMEEELHSDGNKWREENEDFGFTVINTLMGVGPSNTVAEGGTSISDVNLSFQNEFTKKEYEPHYKHWTSSVHPLNEKDLYQEILQAEHVENSLMKDVDIYKGDETYNKNGIIMSGVGNGSEQQRGVDGESIMQELQMMKSAAYTLQTVYESLLIELTHIKKFLKEETDLINRTKNEFK